MAGSCLSSSSLVAKRRSRPSLSIHVMICSMVPLPSKSFTYMRRGAVSEALNLEFSQIPRQNIRPAVTVQIDQGERVPQSGRAGDFHRTVPGIVDDLEVRPLGSHNQIRSAVAVHVHPPGAG